MQLCVSAVPVSQDSRVRDEPGQHSELPPIPTKKRQRNKILCVPILNLIMFANFVTLGKSLNFSGVHFPHKGRIIAEPTSEG